MKRTVIAILLAFAFLIVKSQTVSIVKDPANNGQLKRMVFIEWDDFDKPGGFNGWWFWKILNRKYRKGDDKRPWKTDGPFLQNYASLELQYLEDKKVTDETQAAYDIDKATFLNMSGGDLDLPYSLYFKGKFESLYDALNKNIKFLANNYPDDFAELQQKVGYKNFMEFLDLKKDQVKGIHESFVDKGVRIEAYLDALNEIRYKAKVFYSYLSAFETLAKLPSVSDLKKQIETKPTNSDKEIVKDILKNYKYY